MSGGAYDYLCFKEPYELISSENKQYLERAIVCLTDLGRTREATMLSKLIELGNKVDTLGNAVKDMLYEVEWYESGDISETELVEKLEQLGAREVSQTTVAHDDFDVEGLRDAVSTMTIPRLQKTDEYKVPPILREQLTKTPEIQQVMQNVVAEALAQILLGGTDE